MALYRLLQNSALLPDDIERMVDAYESVLKYLNLPGGDNPTNRRSPSTSSNARRGGRETPRHCAPPH